VVIADAQARSTISSQMGGALDEDQKREMTYERNASRKGRRKKAETCGWVRYTEGRLGWVVKKAKNPGEGLKGSSS